VSQTPPVDWPVPAVRGRHEGEGCQVIGVEYQEPRVSSGEFQVVWVVAGEGCWEDEGAGSERLLTVGEKGVVTVEWESICRAS